MANSSERKGKDAKSARSGENPEPGNELAPHVGPKMKDLKSSKGTPQAEKTPR